MRISDEILKVSHLSVTFARYDGALRQSGLEAIKNVSINIRAGELVAVVGASGAGKSLLAHAILGILPYNASMGGELIFMDEPLTLKRLERLRGRDIALIPQGVSYLDPLMRVGEQVRGGRNDQASRQKARALLSRYGFDETVERMYPHELSGGMARRVLIATAMMESPRLVIADEPTPGLHLATARRVLGHLREIAEGGAGVLLITHDLELALEAADRIVIFYEGETLEEVSAPDFMDEAALRHPYTKALRRAMNYFRDQKSEISKQD